MDHTHEYSKLRKQLQKELASGQITESTEMKVVRDHETNIADYHPIVEIHHLEEELNDDLIFRPESVSDILAEIEKWDVHF